MASLTGIIEAWEQVFARVGGVGASMSICTKLSDQRLCGLLNVRMVGSGKRTLGKFAGVFVGLT